MSVGTKFLINQRYLFDPGTRSLKDCSTEKDTLWLGTNESNILLAFISRPKALLSRETLHDLVWTDNGFHVDESSVVQAISTLRKLLEDSVKSPSFIKTIPKHGYQFIADIEEISVESNDAEIASATDERISSGTDENRDLANAKRGTKEKRYFAIIACVFIFISIALFLEVKQPPLEKIGEINGVAVSTPKTHLMMASDKEVALKCVAIYIKNIQSIEMPMNIVVNLDSQGGFMLHADNQKLHNIITTKENLLQECERLWGNSK